MVWDQSCSQTDWKTHLWNHWVRLSKLSPIYIPTALNLGHCHSWLYALKQLVCTIETGLPTSIWQKVKLLWIQDPALFVPLSWQQYYMGTYQTGYTPHVSLGQVQLKYQRSYNNAESHSHFFSAVVGQRLFTHIPEEFRPICTLACRQPDPSLSCWSEATMQFSSYPLAKDFAVLTA